MTPEILEVLLTLAWIALFVGIVFILWKPADWLLTRAINWLGSFSPEYKRQVAEHQKALDLQARIHEQQRSTSIRIANLREQYKALGPDADEKRDK